MSLTLSPDALRVFRLLERHPLLLVQDAALPNAVCEIAGDAVAGSWWSHPASHSIYRALNEVADHPDVMIAKLLNRKQTLIHRRLFGALASIGEAREPWQMERLQRSDLALLAQLDRGLPVRAAGAAARRLELALLVASEEVHMSSGAHAKELSSWARFRKRRAVPFDGVATAAGSSASRAWFARWWRHSVPRQSCLGPLSRPKPVRLSRIERSSRGDRRAYTALPIANVVETQRRASSCERSLPAIYNRCPKALARRAPRPCTISLRCERLRAAQSSPPRRAVRPSVASGVRASTRRHI